MNHLAALALTVASLVCAGVAGAGIGQNIHPARGCPELPGNDYVRVDRYLNWDADPVFDACMAKIKADGRQAIVTVVYVGGSADPATYAARLSGLATQWPGTVWEVWNEQNHSTFWQGTQAEYMALLRAASTAIRAADPTATVLLGGLAWRGAPLKSPHEWLRRAYQMGLRGLVDGIAIHPYTAVKDWPKWLENIRRIQWRYHDPCPLWLTEFGEPGMKWPQAQKIARGAVQRFPFVQAAVWYDLDADLEVSP